MSATNFTILRQKHPQFIYRSYAWEIKSSRLFVEFNFEITPDIHFTPRLIIPSVRKDTIDKIGASVVNNLIFHLGLMEIPSYWKVSCAPEIRIQATALDRDQIRFWQELLINSLGEFFFTNNIDFTSPDFVKIVSDPIHPLPISKSHLKLKNRRVLIPLGGGKDSLVTYELIKKTYPVNWLCLNPTPAAKKIINTSGNKNPVIVERLLDPQLLELNRQGYLNGHTPFSAYLAFLSSTCALMFDYQWVALSNERSSDEFNLIYKGKQINHQYSKSLEFESLFRTYWLKNINSCSGYFSFLRPLYELQIGKLFAKLPQYFTEFKSCNKNQKNNSWCARCAKCLSITLSLLPWTDRPTLKKIFGGINPLELTDNQPLLNYMTGKIGYKPFECVTTIEEAQVCLEFIEKGLTPHVQEFLSRFGNAPNTPLPFLNILKSAYADS